MAETTSNPPRNIREQIEALAARVVLADVADVQALADLHTCFEELGVAAEGQPPVVRAAAEKAVTLVAEVILGDAPDPARVMQALGETVTALQLVVRDRRNPAEVKFPADLGLAGPAASAAPPPQASDGFSAQMARETSAMTGDFLNEVTDRLDTAESLLLELKDASPAPEALYKVCGQFHSIKGSANLLGLQDLSRAAHEAETALELAASGKLSFQAQTRDMVLHAIDRLRIMSEELATGAARPPGGRAEVGQPAPTPTTAPKAEAAAPDSPPAVPAPAALTSGDISVDPELLADFISESMEHLEAAEKHLLEVGKGGAGEHLNAIFRAFHTIKGVAGFLNLDAIRGLAHDAETLLDLARTGKLSLEGDTIELVFGTIDHLRTLIGKDTAKGGTAGRAGTQDLRAQIRKASNGDAKGGAAPAGTPATATSGTASPSSTAAAEGPEKAQPAEAASGGTTVKVRETIRLDAERVDRLVDAIGELVIAESMVEQVIEQAGQMTDQLHRHMNQLGKISRELQTMGTSLQLVTVRPVFQKLVRLVHDLSRKMNKPVNFVVLGEDTELDKTVVDQIGDPLVHMLRNAIDHGLEDSVEARRQAGKPDAGRVELRAFQRGGNIYIEVEDDGRGLNREAIMAKALKQGLIRDGQTVTDREVYNLIMLPGFSTAAKVTEVSGRGVGMDVVKRNIETLRGQVEITSTTGKGTLFSIRLPLTLAIIDGMIVKVGSERYIIPTLSLIRTVKPDAQDISSVLNRGVVLRENNELLTVVSLGEQLAVDHGAGSLADGLVVIVEAEGRRAGLLVDALLGKQQIVIKSLGETMRQIPGVAGGAIMPDGNVALILDIDGLVRMATSRKEEPAAAAVA